MEVYSRPQSGDQAVGYRWSSTGHDGEFEMCEVPDVPPGTKIVLHLKGDSLEFADEEVIDKILRKYSNFVTAPIFLNGRRINVIEPTWVKDPTKVCLLERRPLVVRITFSAKNGGAVSC